MPSSSPLVKPGRIEVDPKLEALAHALDGLFRVPGTDWRFGLDALVGLVPGVGDILTSVASFSILIAAVRYRVPKITILRMAMNLAIDYLVGSIPVAGDAFDFVWKANAMNMDLLRERGKPLERAHASTTDYLFVFGIIAFLVALLIATAALAVWALATVLHFLSS
ncbi:MAG TPA: DUF4112 domain-containing protein [Polyangiaceae bacterium]